MSELELSGLRGDLPIGAMASFGVLRVCERVMRASGVRLRWKRGKSAFTPVLCAEDIETSADLVALLMGDVRHAPERPELKWSGEIKSLTRDEFVEHARLALGETRADSREEADWFAAFGNELAAGKEGLIQQTPFDMSVARQRFPADALKLGAALASSDRGRSAKTPQDDFEEALFGPWRYEDDQHSLGWDPSTVRLGAFTNRAPTQMKNAGVRAAVWLAFESLPLFPVFFADGGQRVRAFARENGRTALCWPIWEDPISLPALKSLLCWPGVTGGGVNPLETSARGILAIYRSEVFKPNKYLASFRPPELLYSGALQAAY